MAGGPGKDRLTPSEARAAQLDRTIRLIDIRRPDEWLQGTPAGAEPVPLDALLAGTPPDPEAPRWVLICGAGNRSRDAVQRLRDAGLEAGDVEGGVAAWTRSGLPVVVPESPLSPTELDRYARHLALPGFGEAGQLALKRARVLLVGCGGLGSPAALYLAAAGVGRLTLVDDDVVERSNLQRQVLHDERGLGRSKVESAFERLSALNPEIELKPLRRRLDEALAGKQVPQHDLVIDGSDNFPTRCAVNAACFEARVPMVYGAVERFAGQVGLFHPGAPDQSCYRCLFPDIADAGEAPGCAEAGVLGVLPGIIGSMQALEAIRWLTSDPQSRPPAGRIAVFDGTTGDWRRFRVPRDPGCPVCGTPDRQDLNPGESTLSS